jgi:hypothetical protein
VQVPNDAYTISGTTITFTSAPSAGTANIYVRYLSTTTQSITPSQNTVSYSTLNSDNQSKLGISFKNRFINGACVIDQRNNGAQLSAAQVANFAYITDRNYVFGSQSAKFSAGQNAGSVTPPAGFVNYSGMTSASSYSVLSSDYFWFGQKIEGYNIADLNWGSVNAKTITLSFWVRSSLTGTFGGSLQNSDQSRSYPFSYTISAANTWTQVSITVAGDQSGTWLTTNGIGVLVNFGLGSGSTYSGTANTWQSGLYIQPTGTVSVVGTSGATFYVTGLQFEVGTQATTFTTAGGSYGAELTLCQRYYYKTFPQDIAPANGAGFTSGIGVPPIGTAYTISALRSLIIFPQVMRATPSITFFNSNLGTPTTGSWSYYGGSWTASTATNVGESSQLYVSPNIEKSASFTSGNSYLVTGFLTASAEL